MPFCPICKIEYRDGFTKCSNCGYELMDSISYIDNRRDFDIPGNPGAKKLKHAKIGVWSFLVSLIPIVYFIVQTIQDIIRLLGPIESNSDNNMQIGIFFAALIIMLIASIVSLALGIVALLQKNSKKVFPILGIVISGTMLLGCLIFVCDVLFTAFELA